jgi:hypothetical protein
MNGSIAAIITLGFGSWGSNNLLPTLGFGIGEVQSGGLVCATVTIVPSVRSTTAIEPSVTAIAQIERC